MLILNFINLKTLSKFAGIALISLLLSNCSIFEQRPKPGLVEPSAAVPVDFLFSWHKPYNKWMDTPIRVYYNEVSLEEIFKNHEITLIDNSDITDNLEKMHLDLYLFLD